MARMCVSNYPCSGSLANTDVTDRWISIAWRFMDPSAKVVLYNNNLSALQLTEHRWFHARTKHVDVRYHYIRELRKHESWSSSTFVAHLIPTTP